MAMPEDGPWTWPGYWLLTVLTGFVALLPTGLAYALGDALGLLVYGVTLLRERRANRRGRGALRTMRLVLGRDQPPAQLRRRALAYGRHVGRLVIEVLRLRRLTRARLRRTVDLREFEQARALLAEGKGLIVATGHMGNWELFSYATGLEGVPLVALARPIPEPGVQRWLQEHRARGGQKTLPKFGGMWPLKKTVDRGGVAGLNVDENTRDGMFVPFAGVLAATNPSVAQLQRLTKAPVAVMTCQRLGVDRFKVHLWAVVRHDPTRPQEEEARRVVGEVARGLERALRTYPDQWLWALRRFETRPPGELPGPDGLPPPATAG